MIQCLQSFRKTHTPHLSSTIHGSQQQIQKPPFPFREKTTLINLCESRKIITKSRRKTSVVCGGFLPVDPWAPTIDSQSIASSLFAASLFPYLGFLYFITKSKTAPKLTLFGFYFLLLFVGATIPAGIYAKVQYGTSLSNVDWLHGGAESLLTLTNLFIVMGLMTALRKSEVANGSTTEIISEIEEDN